MYNSVELNRVVSCKARGRKTFFNYLVDETISSQLLERLIDA